MQSPRLIVRRAKFYEIKFSRIIILYNRKLELSYYIKKGIRNDKYVTLPFLILFLFYDFIVQIF